MPQNQAITAGVQKATRETFGDLYKVRGNVPEGSASSGWIILDYGDIMVHIMTPKSRLYFDIEGKWRVKGAEHVDISTWLTMKPSSSPLSLTNGATTVSKQENVEEDPFWS